MARLDMCASVMPGKGVVRSTTRYPWLAFHERIRCQIDALDVEELCLESPEQRRAHALSVLRRLNGKRADQTNLALDQPADAAYDRTVLLGDQRDLVLHVVLDRGGLLLQWWNLLRATAAALFLEGALLQAVHGGDVGRHGAMDGVHAFETP